MHDSTSSWSTGEPVFASPSVSKRMAFNDSVSSIVFRIAVDISVAFVPEAELKFSLQ